MSRDTLALRSSGAALAEGCPSPLPCRTRQTAGTKQMGPGTGEPSPKTESPLPPPKLCPPHPAEPLRGPPKPPLCSFSSPPLPQMLPFHTPCTVNMRKTKAKETTKPKTKQEPPLPPPNLGEKKIILFHQEQDLAFFFFSLLIPFSFFSRKDGKIWAVVGWFSQAPKQGTQ